MTTAITESTELSLANEKPEIVAFLQQRGAIVALAEKYMPLTINGIDDKIGFNAVHDARMDVKGKRIAIEKRRKDLKADALAYGRSVDTAARVLTDLLGPIEEHLEAEENAVTAERERIKQAAEDAKRAKLQARLDSLAAVNCIANPLAVEAQTDEQFATSLTEATALFEDAKRRKAEQEAELARLDAERKRREAEEAEARAKEQWEAAERRKAEEAALAKERERLAAIQREQQAEADRLAAEKRRLEDEAAAQRRAAEVEKAKAEAAEKARKDAEERHAAQVAREKAAAEAKAAKEKAEREAAEAARIKAEEERPHRERMIAVADAVDAIQVPEGPLSLDVCQVLQKAAAEIRAIAKAKKRTT